MIDWNRLTFDPVLSALGDLLRACFGAQVRLVDPYGQAYAVGSGEVAVERLERLVGSLGGEALAPVAAEVAKKSGEGASKGSKATADDARDASAQGDVVEGEAGLYQLVFSLASGEQDESVKAWLVVAGFVPSELAYEALNTAREVLLGAKLAAANPGDEVRAQLEEVLGELPRLDRRARELMGEIAGRLARRTQDLVAPSAPGVAGLGDDSDIGLEGSADAGARVDGAQFYGMVGQSRSIRELFDAIKRVAPSQSTVLIQGENGTGKELIARAVHAESLRRDGPFVALNCAAVAGDLIASELFGHKRGAFSGAHRDRVGLLQEAHGGTLFLDEIGDMELHLQVKLLRFLQEGTFIPVGDTTEHRVDVRVLCATNQDLEEMVREGRFRQDLFFRINVINLNSPPLRRRRRDIELLANYFLARASKRHGRPLKRLSTECLDELRTHDWPGNVRELENEIDRLVIMSGDAAVIESNLLSERILQVEDELQMLDLLGLQMPEAVEKLERVMILHTLRKTGWNKSQSARILGVSRRNLIRKVQNLGLEDSREG